MAEEQAPVLQTTPGRDVFISHASLDKTVADRVCEALERDGVRCWIAPRDVATGDFYADSIVRALDASRIIVLVLSEHSIASPHVLREVERASAKRHPVISLRLDQASPPPGLEYFLNTSQWLDASQGEPRSALPKLVEAVRRQLSSPPNIVPPRAGHSAPTPTGKPLGLAAFMQAIRRPTRLGIALCITIAIGLAYVAANKLWPPKPLTNMTNAVIPPGAVPAPPVISEKSIAVLPFLDMSEKHDQEYFSDGLSEELIDMLTKVPDLRVPARTSSFYFKGKQATIAEIAKALGVAQILEGSVRKSGNNLRITAQLIRADNGYHVWSETYDRKLDDIFKVQDEIGTAVVKALKASLLNVPARRRATETGGEAYTVYLQGRSIYENANSAAVASSGVEYLERAAKLDPNFAPVWATLSRAYISNHSDYEIGTYTDVRNAAYHAAEQALNLDPDSAEAHVSMGRVHLLEWDWRGAESEIGRALALDPANATVARNAYYLSLRLGRFDDAIAHTRAAAELDPLNYYNYVTLGSAEFYAGKLAEAEADYGKASALRSDWEGLHSSLASVLWARGKPDEALAESEREPDEAARELNRPFYLGAVGRTKEADRAMAVAESKYGKSFPFTIGELYASRNDLDRAFAWWDRAYLAHDDGLSGIKVAPIEANSKQLALDPRFKALLRRMNLPE